MARRDLEELLAAQMPATVADAPVLDLRTPTPPPEAGSPPTRRDAVPVARPPAESQRSGRVVKKQFNVRADQFRRLDEIVDAVNATRDDRTERISGSTLVRIAIDALIEHSSALHGNTEAELADALRTHLRRAWT